MSERSAESSYIHGSPEIVVLGGGTGSFTILQSLKELTPNITAMVSMADNGGSTGELRDEYGVLPPGDVRQCLVALSESPYLRDLFDYRFDKGKQHGHSLGNLILTALEKQTGSFADGVKAASEMLNITGRVVPVTLDNVHLVADMSDGRHIEGETTIDEAHLINSDPVLSLYPAATLNPEAESAITSADLVVIAPGDLYTSLAPALVVPGMKEALDKSSALIAYMCNLVVKPGHTEGMTVTDHANEIERFMGAKLLDAVIYNTTEPVPEIAQRYRADEEYMVAPPDTTESYNYELIGAPLIASTMAAPSTGDKLSAKRSFIRHEPDLVRGIVRELLSR